MPSNIDGTALENKSKLILTESRRLKMKTGNYEPTDLYYGSEKTKSTQQPPPPPSPPQPPVAPPRSNCLTERLEMLSSPHEPDDLNSGFVECLPPEGLLLMFSFVRV